MSNVAMGASSSLVFGVPLGRVVAITYGWKAIFLIFGILSVLTVFLIARAIPDMEAEESATIRRKLAFLKNPQIAVALGLTLFVFIGFSLVDTYITPYLTAALPMMKQNISLFLMFLGIGSLIGSKLGGFLSDRIGIPRTLRSAMLSQILFLVVLSVGSHWSMIVIPLLMLWEISCWTFGPTQNFNLVSLAPEASGIALSLNSTFVQLGIAAGAGIGGLVVGRWSIMFITWISSVSAIVALMIFARTCSNATTLDTTPAS